MRLWDVFFGDQDLLVPYFRFREVAQDDPNRPELREIFKLRYEVYCLERAFLDAEVFTEGMETDEFDRHSFLFGGFHRDDDFIVGTVRLVQPGPEQQYPWQEHCTAFAEFKLPPREQSGEVSRLVVRKTYRRRRGDSMEGISQEFREKGTTASIKPAKSAGEQRGNSPLLLLGLYREMYRHSRANGIRYWYAAMERSLARSLDRMGFRFEPIGPKVDYYGPVIPHMVDLDECMSRLKQQNQFLHAWFNDLPIPLPVRIKTRFANWRSSRATRS